MANRELFGSHPLFIHLKYRLYLVGPYRKTITCQTQHAIYTLPSLENFSSTLPSHLHAAANKCPATKALPCIASKFYVTPDLSLALNSPSIPDLTVLGIDPAVDLRAVLPYNDAISL